MTGVGIAGVGMTRFGFQPEATLKSLTAEAVGAALDDAGLGAADIDAVFFANAIGGAITSQEMVAGQVALRPLGLGGVPVVNVENACASASTALSLGRAAILAGTAERVLCVGAEKMSHRDKAWALAAIGRAVDVEAVFGADGPQPGGRSYFMDIYAGEGRALLERGASRADLAAVAAKNHTRGAHNPHAQRSRALSVEEVLAARLIVDPLTLPMCSPLSDGAAAAVLTAGPADVALRGCAVASGGGEGSATRRAALAAYEQAGVGPQDADVIELHDAAAPAEIVAYEALGLDDDGLRYLRDGHADRVNPSGGLLAKGHPIGATGLAQLFEVVTQVRGRAGDRQVAGARTGLCHNGGGWIDGDNAAAVVTVVAAA